MHLLNAIIRQLALVLSAGGAVLAQVTQPVEHSWMTDGSIRDAAVFRGIVYAGGTFTYVGQKTGSLGVANSSSGALVGASPAIEGVVWAIIPDGRGGWFVGGSFTNVGGLPRTNLVRLKADLSIDPTIFPALIPTVSALALTGTNLAVAGSFQTRGATNLILLSSESGEPLNWQPHSQSPPYQIKALAAFDGKIYVPEPSGVNATYIAVIDPQAQTRRRLGVNLGWEARAIYSLAVAGDGSALFVGGNFNHIGIALHGPVASIDLQTETIISWDPLPHLSQDYYVSSIVAGTNNLFVAANRPTSAPVVRPVVYDGVVWAFDTASLQTKWSNSLSFGSVSTTVNALAVQNEKVFVGGNFLNEDGQFRRRTAALNAETGDLDSWVCHANGNVNAFAVDGDRVAFGGQLTSAGGVARENLAAFDIAVGSLTEWKPITEPNSRIDQIQGTEFAVIVGGRFRKLNGVDRIYIGALDPITGATLVDFNAQIPSGVSSGFPPIRTMARAGNYLYFGGYFTNSPGFDHKYLAAMDVRTLEIKSTFRPILNNGVWKIIANGNVIYVAGDFTQANGLSRYNLAALDGETGEVLPWAPVLQRDAAGTPAVTSMAIHGTTLYLAGTLTKVNGQNRLHSAAVDVASGETLSWILPVEISILASLLSSTNSLFLAQDSSIQAYDYVSGAKLGWEGQLPGLGYSLIETESALIISGEGGISLFPKTPIIKPFLQPEAGFSISAMPGQNFSIDGSPDLLTWRTVLKTNALLKSFVGPPLQANENRFYRVTPSP